VQMYAMAMGKLAVMNHPLMSWLFSHPDSRQSWTPLQLTAPFLNKAMRHEIIPLESAAVNAKNIKFVGLHGVSSLHNSYRKLNPLVASAFGVRRGGSKIEQNLMCQAFAAWSLSALTSGAQNALLRYKRSLRHTCGGESMMPDLVVQLRTGDVTQRDLSEVEEDCHVACAVRKAKSILDTSGKDVCVFISSNRANTSARVQWKMNSLLNTAKHSRFKFFAQQDDHHRKSDGITHTGDFIQATRKSSTLDRNSLEASKDYNDIMHWLIIGEAISAVHSQSTFMLTARLRLGSPQRRVFSPMQLDIQPSLDGDDKCSCLSHLRHCSH